jgi:hypothetical protein
LEAVLGLVLEWVSEGVLVALKGPVLGVGLELVLELVLEVDKEVGWVEVSLEAQTPGFSLVLHHLKTCLVPPVKAIKLRNLLDLPVTQLLIH